MKLAGKTRDELTAALADKSRGELLELIFSLVTFDQLLSAGQIAERSRMSRRDVLADMKAGRFVCPIHGRGFFCRASNSLRVTAAAANAWRRSFFVPVELAGDPIASHKREIEPGDRSPISPATDQHGPNIRQRRAVVRRLSPSFLASK